MVGAVLGCARSHRNFSSLAGQRSPRLSGQRFLWAWIPFPLQVQASALKDWREGTTQVNWSCLRELEVKGGIPSLLSFCYFPAACTRQS